MRKQIQSTTILGLLVLAASTLTAQPSSGAELLPRTELRVRHPEEFHRSQVLPQPLVVPSGMAYQFDVWIEPFLQPKHPGVSGVDCIDGTMFKLGWMNTSNIGRQCELTWWSAYEVFRRRTQETFAG